MCSRIKIFLVVVIIFSVNSVTAQTYVTLTPMLGLNRCFAKFDGGDKPDLFKNNASNHQIIFGGLIDYHKNKFIFSTGYLYNHAGYAYSIKSVGHQADSGSWGYKHSSANQGWTIPLRVSYYLFKTNGKFINFKLDMFGGIAIDHFSPRPFSTATYSNAHVETKSTYKTINQYGVSANIGLTFQFLHRGKESIALTFYYNQGLTKYESIRLNYTTLEDNRSYQSNLITRGTSFGILLSYPIKIWDVDKRRSIKSHTK
ncbi:outer membrane beta-barrel protein [Cytophaga aurantiaca]|uniref:outer membrane beta-barrel protein n=1 Tax=Cytophaga aurantiaca TaxID=29530 RepID=UPI0003756E11|nr:outer membrane beta-barrel protein [Cytophaga aurantiaca]